MPGRGGDDARVERHRRRCRRAAEAAAFEHAAEQALRARGRSSTSPRNSVPLRACSNSPGRPPARAAEQRRRRGVVAQRAAIERDEGPGGRGPDSCTKRASASRPVPDSPTSSSAERCGASRVSSVRNCAMARLLARPAPAPARHRCCRICRLRLPASSARSTVRSSFASDSGFSTKSKAPRRVASTAVSTVPWPDIITTGQPSAGRSTIRAAA